MLGAGKKAGGYGGTAEVCRKLGQPPAEALGLRIWDVRFVREGATWILRYIIDKDEGVSMEDCVAFTRAINPVLDRADPIDAAYCLEVSSPGIERELTRPEHFEEFVGWPVTVQLIRPLDGQRLFPGFLEGLEGGTVTISDEQGQSASFAMAGVASVKIAEPGDGCASGGSDISDIEF